MFVFAAIAVLALADPALAPAPSPAASAIATAPSKPAKPRLICKSEAVVGSRLPTKVCMTAEDFAERKARDREALDRAQTLQTQKNN